MPHEFDFMTRNLQPGERTEQMTTKPNVSNLTETLADVLRESHGHQACVAAALGWPRQRVASMLAGEVTNPLIQTKTLTETLRKNGHSHADEPFLALARELGFVAYLEAGRTEAHDFSTLCREFADLVAARADAGTEIDAAEALRIERQAFELIEAARGYIDDVRASVKSNVRRMA